MARVHKLEEEGERSQSQCCSTQGQHKFNAERSETAREQMEVIFSQVPAAERGGSRQG